MASSSGSRGNNDLVRSAIIQTVNGVTNRPISKLYPLEVNVRMNMSGRSQEVVEYDNDGASDTLPQQDIESPLSPHPQRSAAVKGKARVAEWSKILKGQEDVLD